ncbi:mevalonate diphosphate decarboxylase [Legionella beliardensis]|uniref:Mevalonate diphosphate decarboxylase n=1 Tax=Legionella beliardensis TaxID=91822 RepID=A0A378I4Y1_9GAMM|nr:diphosphomevalonate decarboxylase [Legionella beliardensis]STX29810.1 mevalonate diphosphate decarboxylase [Legionella beliardensis]
MQWFAQAPANIALIKYMGKKDSALNIPANPSLSYTLNKLLTNVTLETHPGRKDVWEPLHIPGALPFALSEKAQERFLNHLSFLKDHFGYSGSFIVRSSNNFPHGNGLASSASSFAALTICAVRAICECQNISLPAIEEQAQLSRHGSGSSCRSFFSPWAFWEEEKVGPIELPYDNLHHQVIIISHDEKQIPSSQAHQLIKTSPLYLDRLKRACENLQELLSALNSKSWSKAYDICWREFQDMHHLFTTCDKPFTYMTENTKLVLKDLQNLWERHGDGPIVTMDAGPNIHLLYRPEQTDMALQFKRDFLVGNYDVL